MNTAIDSAITDTLLYHEQTKHHFHRFARSLGFLDWANQPNPFRFYEGVTAVRLPFLQKDAPAWPKHSASIAPTKPLWCGEGPACEHLALYERSRNVFQDFTRETPVLGRGFAGPGHPGLPDTPHPFYAPTAQSEIPAAQIIRQRQSAVAFDGVSRITKDQFCAMLDKTLPREACAPFDLGLTVACVHLLLFVHRVTGLESGLYFLLRVERELPALRQKCHRHFLWRPADEVLPLYLLQAGDFQSTATSVSCQQSVAGDGAFSLGMIARFRDELETAPYRYRHLFWETGMIGQVLYLEAPRFGLAVNDFLQLLVDHVTLREQVVQCLAEDAPEGGLRNERMAFQRFSTLTTVHDAEINYRIDRRGRVVAGHHLLLRNVDSDHTQVHLDHAISRLV